MRLLATGGLMAKAADAGQRVVLVTVTNGELGEPQPGVLAEGEELWERRVVELAAAAKVLGRRSSPGARVPRLGDDG